MWLALRDLDKVEKDIAMNEEKMTYDEFEAQFFKQEWWTRYRDDLIHTAYEAYRLCDKPPFGFITANPKAIQKQRAKGCTHGLTAMHWEGEREDDVESDSNKPTYKPHTALAAFRWAQARGNELLLDAKKDMTDMIEDKSE
jgi:hypothetical protein